MSVLNGLIKRARARKTPMKCRAARKRRNVATLLMSLALALSFAAAGTLAWLSAQSELQNTFTVGNVACKVEENFDKDTGKKTNVRVENTGDVPAYIRVRLVTYRQNAAGQTIGGAAPMDPVFTPANGWVKIGDYYYYKTPVDGGHETDVLISSYTLKTYTDADGGSQVLEVLAEAIQSMPADAVHEAWGVTVASDGSLNP